MSNLTPYLWQQAQWHRLTSISDSGSLPHALLFDGPEGTGKSHFSRVFAQRALCKQPTETGPCGECKDCQLIKADTHPDFYVVEPEEKSRYIKIDQIRSLTDSLQQTAQQGGMKVAILHPAEALNENAANALLKTLEEPSEHTLLILVCHSASRLMATIRSRCQRFSFPIPSSEDAIDWLKPLATGHDPFVLLKSAAGAPIKAKQLLEGDGLERIQQVRSQLGDVAEGRMWYLDASAQLAAYAPEELVDDVLSILYESLKPAPSGRSPAVNALISIDSKIRYRFSDKLISVKRQLQSSANPNKQLIIDELLMDWEALFKTQTSAKLVANSV